MSRAEYFQLLLFAIRTVALIIWIASGVCIPVAKSRLLNYLERCHNKRWRYVTSIFCIGPGAANDLRLLPYVFSKEDNDDHKIVALKRTVKRSLFYFVGAFMVFMLTSLLIAR